MNKKLGEWGMKIGFIGAGNMAKAMLGGILMNDIFKKEEIIASDANSTVLSMIESSLGIYITTDNKEVVRQAEVIVLAVKPQYYESVIEEIKEQIKPHHIVVTIAPGQTLERLEGFFGRTLKLVRTMPNTPALVGEGMTAACKNAEVTEQEMEYICKILSGFGKVEIVDEHLMDVVVSVSGSSPAYVFMFIEAMADAAVADGMPRKQAYEFAAQTVLGSAKMVLETGKHPGELKDMVCSPGGTTIEAVRVLEQKGLRSTIFEAMKACTKKAKGM